MTTEPEPLPGLEEPARPPASLELGVRRTLTHLHALGYVTEADAGKTALALELAQVIAVKRASGRASTIGNDARVLMEILDSFQPEDTDADAQLQEAMEKWAEVINGAGPAPADPGPEVRDAT